MPTDRRLLWEVQTLAANLEPGRLQGVRDELERILGPDYTREIIETWEHELDELDDD